MVRAPPAGHTGYPTPPVHATREAVVEKGSELSRALTPAPRASSPATMSHTAAHLATSRVPDEELPAEARAREEARDATACGPPGEQKHGRRPRLARQEGEMARWRDGEMAQKAQKAQKAPPSPQPIRTRDQPARDQNASERATTSDRERYDGEAPAHIPVLLCLYACMPVCCYWCPRAERPPHLVCTPPISRPYPTHSSRAPRPYLAHIPPVSRPHLAYP